MLFDVVAGVNEFTVDAVTSGFGLIGKVKVVALSQPPDGGVRV
jgi:hypothetical protein